MFVSRKPHPSTFAEDMQFGVFLTCFLGLDDLDTLGISALGLGPASWGLDDLDTLGISALGLGSFSVLGMSLICARDSYFEAYGLNGLVPSNRGILPVGQNRNRGVLVFVLGSGVWSVGWRIGP